jgi:biotin operon repressor
MTIIKPNNDDERKIIIQIITNTEVCKSIIPSLDYKLLTSPHSKLVYNWVKGYFDKYDEAPGKDITNLWKNNSKYFTGEEDEIDLVKKFLKSISEEYAESPEKFNIQNTNYAIDEIHEYLKKRTIQIYQERIHNALEDGEDPTAIIEAYKPYASSSALPPMDNAEELKTMELPKAKYLISDLFGWGLIMLAGTHKIGKSFMMLQLAVAVSTGGIFLGKYKCKKRKVIYLCLEDGRERLKKRINDLGFEDKDLSGLNFIYESRKGKEGLIDLSLRLKQCLGAKLIIIDALATFRGNPQSRSIFQSDYDTMREIKKWADENKVCIILVHHTRKPGVNNQGPADIVDSVNGSNGLGAAVDQTFIMTRQRKSIDGKLYTVSRDIEEKDLAIQFHLHSGGWEELGDADSVDMSNERKNIIALIEENDGSMKSGEIAKALGKAPQTISTIIKKLVDDGYLIKTSYGAYSIRP